MNAISSASFLVERCLKDEKEFKCYAYEKLKK